MKSTYLQSLPQCSIPEVREEIQRCLLGALGNNYHADWRKTAKGNIAISVYYTHPRRSQRDFCDVTIVIMEPYVRMQVRGRWVTVASCSEIVAMLPLWVTR